MKESGRLAARLACIGVVLCVVFPLGQLVYPAMADLIGAFPFSVVEAMATATLGYGLFEALFK